MMLRNSAKVFFICCFFGIGNSVLFYPVIKNLKKLIPGSKIIVGALKYRNEEYFSLLPEVDEVVVLNSIRRAYRDISHLFILRKTSVDITIVPYLSENCYAWLISRFIGSHSIGYDQKGRFYDSIIPLERKHELEINIDIIRTLMPDKENIITKDTNPGIQKPDIMTGGKKIGFHASAHASMNEKCWAYSNFVSLGKLLHEHGKTSTYLFGGGTDTIEEYKDGDFDVNLVGKLSLKEAMEKISEMDLFVSNDSGLMHIAASLNVPVVSIFGPTDDLKNAPVVEKRLIIKQGMECRPCYRPWTIINCTQPSAYQCLKEITPESVFSEIIKSNLL